MDRDLQRTIQSLRDFLRFSEMSAELIVARGRAAFDADLTLRLAAESVLHKIGEAVARLPETFIDDHPKIPWKAMQATRNIVAHRYDQVDYEIIWTALADRLPEDAEQVRRILADLEA